MFARMFAIGILCLVTLPMPAVASNPDWMAASGCRLSFGTNPSQVGYYDGELYASGTTNSFIDCAPSVLPTVHDFSIYYVDNVASGNLRCYAYQRRADGSLVVGFSRFSCSTAGGCDSNSDPGFASNTQRNLDFNGGLYPTGATCEVPPGVTVRFLHIQYAF
jgi:hypothetical protein